MHISAILNYCGNNIRTSRRRYSAFVKDGIDQGRRPELVGGGLIRSLGGWSEVEKLRLKGMDRLKGDERILGDTDFVQAILAHAKEHFERHYELQRLGYDLDTMVEKVALIYGIDSAEVFRKSRQKPHVDARGLFYYWAARELKIPLSDLARKLEMTISGVGYAVQRGEAIALRHDIQFLD